MEKIYVGNITGTHGIKGELKVLSDFERKDLVFKKGYKLNINNKDYTITSHRHHKNFELITVDDIYDINEIYYLVKEDVYISREDYISSGGKYLTTDLIGFKIISDNEELGIVDEVRYSNKITYLYIKYNKTYYIPYIDEYIENVDLDNKIVYVKNGKELSDL